MEPEAEHSRRGFARLALGRNSFPSRPAGNAQAAEISSLKEALRKAGISEEQVGLKNHQAVLYHQTALLDRPPFSDNHFREIFCEISATKSF